MYAGFACTDETKNNQLGKNMNRLEKKAKAKAAKRVARDIRYKRSGGVSRYARKLSWRKSRLSGAPIPSVFAYATSLGWSVSIRNNVLSISKAITRRTYPWLGVEVSGMNKEHSRILRRARQVTSGDNSTPCNKLRARQLEKLGLVVIHESDDHIEFGDVIIPSLPVVQLTELGCSTADRLILDLEDKL